MSQLILPTKQKSFSLRKELSKSVIFFRDFKAPSIAVTGEAITHNTGTYGVSVVGQSFIADSTSKYIAYDDLRVRTALQNTAKLTVIVEFAALTTSISGFIFGNTQLDGVGYNWGIYVTSGGMFAGYVRNASNVVGTVTTTINRVVNKKYRIQLVYDGSVIKLFINGLLAGQQSQTGNIAVTDYSLAINRWYAASSTPCAVSFVGVFADVLPDMTAETFDIFGQEKQVVYFNFPETSNDSLTSGGLTQLTLTNVTGTGSSTYNATATANIAGLGLGTITALVNSSALVTTNVSGISLSTLTAEGSAGTGSSSQGSLAQLNLTNVAANIAYGVTRQGSFADLSLTNINGLTNWTRNASVVADLASAALSTVIGTGSTVSSYSATGSLTNLGLGTVSGQASSTISSSAQGLISGLTLTTLTATISSQVSSQVTCVFDGVILSTVLGIGFTEDYPGNIQEFGRLDINFTLENSRTLVISEDERLLTITEEPGTLTLERL